ncbi:RNA polymerase sigma factor [Phycisphaerales bacterium AB-hyl4]|uniref:RNA polymerase sigma factor n=1 Tax=Natronomicrosphaera hydrolytica TaxID=3242702 RepID=A0ABV4U7H2_9BACT
MNEPTAEHAFPDTQRERDQQLALAAQAGDRDAFASLVRYYEPRLRRFLRPHVGRRSHDVDDLVQEAFLRAWRNLARYDERWAFSTWLFTIATRLVIDRRRRRDPVDWPAAWEQATAAHATTTAADDGPLHRLIDHEQSQRLWHKAAQLLTREPFTMLWLFYAEQLSVAEVAHAVGRTRTNVKVQLHRARQRLKQGLADPSVHHAPTAAAKSNGRPHSGDHPCLHPAPIV